MKKTVHFGISEKKSNREKFFHDDKNYGPYCEKLDMSSEEFESAKQLFLQGLQKAKQEISSIEERTRSQYNCLEWLKILTASNFGTICRRKATTFCSPLVKSLLSANYIRSASMDWGKNHEAKALEDLEKFAKIKIKKCGLFLNEEYPFLGATPDGLVGDSGLVEIKSPWSARHLTPVDAITQKKVTIWKTTNQGHVSINIQHKWYYQVQGQLAITGRSYCVFCVWTPLGIKTETIM